MKDLRRNWKLILLLLLVVINIITLFSFKSLNHKDHVKVAFLDVGQGDAIYIEASNGNQIILDGGPNRAVLSRLSKVMPIFDRSIDVMIESHPDKDHIGGFPEVVSRYKINYFLEPGVTSDNSLDDELKRRVKEKNISSVVARKGMKINLGDLSYLEILFPDRDVSGLDTNDASIVARYVFGKTCFLFTGDSPQKIEEYIASEFENLECNVLKVGHHGSRTSTGEIYLQKVKPEIAIISAGKDNSYGHPHGEVIDRLKSDNIKILSTTEDGTIILVSDGENIYRK